jgi:uncharacterized Zn-binding protein involved in type VI secretion
MMGPGNQPHRGGALGGGEASVRIGGKPAARAGDDAPCEGASGTVTAGEPSVRIGGKPAARAGDATAHGGKISAGCPTVRIGSTPQRDALLDASDGAVPLCEMCDDE